MMGMVIGKSFKVIIRAVKRGVKIVRPAPGDRSSYLCSGVNIFDGRCIIQKDAEQFVVAYFDRTYISMRQEPEVVLIIHLIDADASIACLPKAIHKMIYPLILRDGGIGQVRRVGERLAFAGARRNRSTPPVCSGIVDPSLIHGSVAARADRWTSIADVDRSGSGQIIFGNPADGGNSQHGICASVSIGCDELIGKPRGLPVGWRVMAVVAVLKVIVICRIKRIAQLPVIARGLFTTPAIQFGA